MTSVVFMWNASPASICTYECVRDERSSSSNSATGTDR